MLSKTLIVGLAAATLMIGTVPSEAGGGHGGGGGPSMWAFYPFLDPYNPPRWCEWEKVNYYRHNRLQERWVNRCPH